MKNWELIELLQRQDPNEDVLVTDRSTMAEITSEITGVNRTTCSGRPRVEIIIFPND